MSHPELLLLLGGALLVACLARLIATFETPRGYFLKAWRWLRGVQEVQGYLSMVEVAFTLRENAGAALHRLPDSHGTLRTLVQEIRPGSEPPEFRVLGMLVVESVFGGLEKEGWIAQDGVGNYRLTEHGLAMLAWHEQRHFGLGPCPTCGEPVAFLSIGRYEGGKIYHLDCRPTASESRRSVGKVGG